MKKKESREEALRRRAEKILSEKEQLHIAKLSEADSLKLIHELQVHQIELELQNEELNEARRLAQVEAERYTKLYDSAPTGYFTLSKDRCIAELNLSGAAMLRRNRTSVISKRFDLYMPDESKVTFNSFLNNVAAHELTRICEVEILSKQSTHDVYLTVAHDSAREQFFISAVDISERKQMELKLKAALEKAEESEKLKTAFLQNLSHEIRTPMNAIIGYSRQLALPEITDKERGSYSSVVIKSTHQLLSVINDIISISLLETRQEKPNNVDVQINELLFDLFAEFKIHAGSKNLKLELTGELPNEVLPTSTDKSKLIQVMSNLLTNALKFTHVGGIEFGCTLQSGELIFFVKDTGIGIHESKRERIFERFQQADENISKVYGGTGLGLSISKGLVEILGGKIWLLSEIDKGSEFYFSIPYRPVDTLTKKPDTKKPVVSKPLFMIVEDDELNFSYLQIVLTQKFDCTLIQAPNGAKAVELCEANSTVDLILMDINMPVMNGYEAAVKIKQINPDIAIIAQTGYDLNMTLEKYGTTIFDHYISKPIDEDILISKINDLITVKPGL